MGVLLLIWILAGAAIGALFSAIGKGGRIDFIARTAASAIGAAAVGWVLQFMGFEIGGPYMGAAINGVVGAFLAQASYVAYDLFS